MQSPAYTSSPVCNNATPSLLLQIGGGPLYGHKVVFGVVPLVLNNGVLVHMLPPMNPEPGLEIESSKSDCCFGSPMSIGNIHSSPNISRYRLKPVDS